MSEEQGKDVMPNKSRDEKAPLDPYKTLAVCYKDGKKVGSIPAAAPHAGAYLEDIARIYGGIDVEYEPDPTGGLLFGLHK